MHVGHILQQRHCLPVSHYTVFSVVPCIDVAYECVNVNYPCVLAPVYSVDVAKIEAVPSQGILVFSSPHRCLGVIVCPAQMSLIGIGHH